ncbi:uncharacterized protein LOC112883286 [Panicum hallii]|jgi:hypothetical protein|uniref:uncharacterized protein LOC112883286 n=1 Tax=Panicum hallii TaxID=206008 RepID=UPI000DF4DFE8|nr:uncharacterized protein LOC112883286 [Panicum hallii]
MQQPSAATPSAAAAYAKVEKMNAEEARHIKAQYLIHKVLEEATKSASARPPRRPPALARARARIGVRLKKLRLAIRGVRARARCAVWRHLRNLRRLVARGGPGSSVKPAPGSSS